MDLPHLTAARALHHTFPIHAPKRDSLSLDDANTQYHLCFCRSAIFEAIGALL